MTTITLSQLCLANAAREEQYDHRYGNRHELFLELLKQIESDIVCIKEVRMCKDKEGLVAHPSKYVRDFCTIKNYECARLEPVKCYSTDDVENFNPFHLCQLYDHKKLIKIKSHCFDYSAEVFKSKTAQPHFGTMVLVCEYALLNDISKTFIVELMHLPIRDDHKNVISQWLKDVYPELRNKIFGDKDIIRVGDFNTFKDSKHHDYQYDNISCGFNAITNYVSHEDPSVNVYGSFFPFVTDVIPGVKIDSPLVNSNNISIVDHIFYKGNFVLVNSCRCLSNFNGTINNFDGMMPISDHLPAVVTFMWL